MRDSHGKPWPDTSSRTKGRCRTEDRIFLGWQRCGGISARGECLKCLWPVQSVVFGPSTAFNAPLKAHRRHSLCMISVNTALGLRILKVACANLLNVPHNSLCIAPHSSCRQSHRSHLHLPFRCLLSQPPPSHLAMLYAALAVNQILNERFSSVWSVLNEAAVGQQHS